MSVDINKGYDDIGKKIAASKTFITIKSDIQAINLKGNSSFEEANKDIANSLDKLKEEKNTNKNKNGQNSQYANF